MVDIIVDGGESTKSLNLAWRGCSHVGSGEVQAVIIAKLTLGVKDLCTLLGRFERRGAAGWRSSDRVQYYVLFTTLTIFVG